jgi:hypothetical protein
VQIEHGEYTELMRARADRANAVFILNSSTAHVNPRELDNKVSLYVVLVKQCVFRPRCKRCASNVMLYQVSEKQRRPRCTRQHPSFSVFL